LLQHALTLRYGSWLAAVLAGTVFLCADLRPAAGQGTPTELREQANLKLGRGEFMDAIPDLQQLIAWLGESDTPRIVASMELVYYQLGIAHFFVGQFDEAEKVFATYLKKYRNGTKAQEAALYIADSLRFRNKLKAALPAYNAILRKYAYSSDLKADIYSAIARCHLADGKWGEAVEPLRNVYELAPDFLRINWAATLLTTAYFKNLDLEKVYPLTPFILRRNSFASRSVAFNMAALEAGEELFASEKYRDAFWVFRMVYPHDVVLVRGGEYLETLQQRADRFTKRPGNPRTLMRLQETIGELEADLEAMEELDNYDLELFFRIARGYMEMMRYREARELFIYLHNTALDQQAEEALFLAFQCSMQILPWDRAFELGEQYMEEYPAGEYFDHISLAMGQLYARQQNWPEVIRHLTRTLEERPQHGSAAECMFLIGYASFMEESFENSVTWLRKMTRTFPASDLVGDATYWTGMALLFDTKYRGASIEFDYVLENFGSGIYAADAAFRRGVCGYGMSEFDDADRHLGAFTRKYPESALVSEATMMRGDIAGVAGRIQEAVSFYQGAMTDPKINIEFYNHCAFQAGTILYDDSKFEELINHFEGYIREKREGNNVPQAIYWIGRGLWDTGERTGALRYYRGAVELYGKTPEAVGIDMILDEWVGRIKRSEADVAEEAWHELQASLDNAIQAGNKTLELRLKRIFLLSPYIKGRERQHIMNQLQSADSIPYASPAVLQKMLDIASEREDLEFAAKVAKHIISVFKETDYALDARMVLAEQAVKNARKASAKHEVDEFYAEAIEHLGVIREVYASSGEAGQALSILGNIYREQAEYGKADECYTSVLGVKAWRNFWPEAVYGRGECAFAQRQYDVASAYYERIYILYSHFKEITSKAYLRRAECLRKLYQDGKAREVLEEMLAKEELATLPEAEEARTLLTRLGGGT